MGPVRWFPNGAGEIKGETVFRYDLPQENFWTRMTCTHAAWRSRWLSR